MQRYFCNDIKDNIFSLSSDDSYHISRVMRMSLGDKIEIIFDNKLYICEIISLDSIVKASCIDCIMDSSESSVKVILVQSLVNEQKMDLILQKGCELGMYEFYPYNAVNSVVKENGKIDKKIVRWQRIVKEASEQSKRYYIPKVNNPISIKELVKIKGDLKLFCSVNELTLNIKKVLENNKNCDTIIIVIGPEGGFSKLEENILSDNGFLSVSLGKRVLRTETAGITCLSMINYEWM